MLLHIQRALYFPLISFFNIFDGKRKARIGVSLHESPLLPSSRKSVTTAARCSVIQVLLCIFPLPVSTSLQIRQLWNIIQKIYPRCITNLVVAAISYSYNLREHSKTCHLFLGYSLPEDRSTTSCSLPVNRRDGKRGCGRESKR